MINRASTYHGGSSVHPRFGHLRPSPQLSGCAPSVQRLTLPPAMQGAVFNLHRPTTWEIPRPLPLPPAHSPHASLLVVGSGRSLVSCQGASNSSTQSGIVEQSPIFRRRRSRPLATSTPGAPMPIDCDPDADFHFAELVRNATTADSSLRTIENMKDKIKEALLTINMTISPYDIAWIAMVPSKSSHQRPCFPECLEWICKSQNQDGSWSPQVNNPFHMKDILSSTLACILALKRWDIGADHVNNGIHFIQSNASLFVDEKQYSPIGFDRIFFGMLQQAKKMGLHISISRNISNKLSCACEKELESVIQDISDDSNKYLAYVVEGLSYNYNWEELLKYQRANGSFFNSPSTTAAFLINIWNEKAFEYLQLLVEAFGSSYPTIQSSYILTHLSMVDTLKNLGISHHFTDYTKNVMDHTYRFWLEDNDEIKSDLIVYALAFRLLRVHGYNVHSSDLSSQIDDGEFFNNVAMNNPSDKVMVLELHKASQLRIPEDGEHLEKINSSCTNVMKETITKSSRNDIVKANFIQEMDYNLKYPYYIIMDRLEHRRYIENYYYDTIQHPKASRLFKGITKVDLLEMARMEFNICQTQYQTELKLLERWFEKCELEKIKFARHKVAYCYSAFAANIFQNDMLYARISSTMNAVLATIIDDFFDVGGSLEEMLNFVDLVRRWDANYEDHCCSETVYILFKALYTTVNELGAIASSIQGYCVTSHIVEIWMELVTSVMQEAEWQRTGIVPTLEQYMRNGNVSFGVGPIILPATYFVGPKLSCDIIRSSEYYNLYELVSTFGRLSNDIQTYERESAEGKLNSLSLLMHSSGGSLTKEEALAELYKMLNDTKVELLGLVLQQNGSVVPRPCKDLFWKMLKSLSTFYATNDGYSSPTDMLEIVNVVLYDPIIISLPSCN